jgi:hypothetical protein
MVDYAKARSRCVYQDSRVPHAARCVRRCARRSAVVKESTVEGYLIEQCQAHGAFCPKVEWPGRRGAPDREITWPWSDIDKVETKRPKGGRYEAGQQQAHKEYAKRGVPVYLLRTKEAVDTYIFWRLKREHAPGLFSVPVELPGPRTEPWRYHGYRDE